MKILCKKYWTGGGGKYLLLCESKNTKENFKDKPSKVSYFEVNEILLDQDSIGTSFSCNPCQNGSQSLNGKMNCIKWRLWALFSTFSL